MRILIVLLAMLIIAPARATDSCDAGYYLNSVGECEICPAGYYCDGEYGKQSCGWGYTNGPGATSADDCIQCPEDEGLAFLMGVAYYTAFGISDSGDGAEKCTVYVFATKESGVEQGQWPNDLAAIRAACNFSSISVAAEYYNPNYLTAEFDSFGVFAYNSQSGTYETVTINPCSTEAGDENVFCMFSDRIPDGTICGDLTGDGFVQCVPCADISPMFTHSDGTRTLPTDCYAISNPGYYIQTNMDTYEVYESECVPGDYCPGGIDVRYDMATDSFFGGNISCATLGDEYTMSDAGATSENMCYKICSVPENQPEIENGTVVSDSNAFYPNVCGYSIKCNDEYGLINNACYAVCNSGVSHMRTSVGNSFTLFAERVTSPSLNISYNNTVCYAPLSPGQSKNTININYNGQIYHLE